MTTTTMTEARRMVCAATVRVAVAVGERRECAIDLREEDGTAMRLAYRMTCNPDIALRCVVGDAVGSACGDPAVDVHPDRLAIIRAIVECAAEVLA